MISNIGFSDYGNSSYGTNDNGTVWLNSQVVSLLTETTGVKVQLKLVAESFAAKFFSSEYYKYRLSVLPKIFTIISETFSEINIRNSSFLISEFTTST